MAIENAREPNICSNPNAGKKRIMARLAAISIMPNLADAYCYLLILSDLFYLLPTTTIRFTGRGLMS